MRPALCASAFFEFDFFINFLYNIYRKSKKGNNWW